MTNAERTILSTFRRFDMQPNKMLCLGSIVGNLNTREFQVAMDSLIEKGMVLRERPKHAYCLTRSGYDASILG